MPRALPLRPVVPAWDDIYPEMADPRGDDWAASTVDVAHRIWDCAVGGPSFRAQAKRCVRRIDRWKGALRTADDAGIGERLEAVRRRLRREAFSDRAIIEGLAVARELARRSTGLEAYPNQLLAAVALLSGRLVEMETGEGKSLTAALAAFVAGLAGVPVHVFTVNDYLAERDAAFASKLAAMAGLEVGIITEKMDEDARRAAYRAPIVYGTNKQIVFDYLRDVVRSRTSINRIGRAAALFDQDSGARQPLLRGLHMAIVDEADSILVDEARTPLVLSRQGNDGGQAALATAAVEIASGLVAQRDYLIYGLERRCRLTEAGVDTVARQAEMHGALLAGRRRREELVTQALYALHFLRPGHEYVVDGGKVCIVDEYTGRIMQDRTWSSGLHQIIEVKEGLKPTPENETLAQITYQRFFRRYRHLSGMTGTAREVAGELRAVYRMPIMAVPPRLRSRRKYGRLFVAPDQAAKIARVVARVRHHRHAGRPVLVGTRTVQASQQIAVGLQEQGIEVSVLNALQHDLEAEVVGRAGQSGRVTVATNLAGRGTDIALGPGVAAAGGLVVILTERHDAGRIDRQLYGRCARQGDPGVVEIIVAMDDDLVVRSSWRHVAPISRWLVRTAPWVATLPSYAIFGRAQKEQESLHARLRAESVRADRRLAELLAFAGPPE